MAAENPLVVLSATRQGENPRLCANREGLLLLREAIDGLLNGRSYMKFPAFQNGNWRDVEVFLSSQAGFNCGASRCGCGCQDKYDSLTGPLTDTETDQAVMAAQNPLIGHVGEPDASGRAEVVLNDEGKRIYGDHFRLVVGMVRPGERVVSQTTSEEMYSGKVVRTTVSRKQPPEPTADVPLTAGP